MLECFIMINQVWILWSCLSVAALGAGRSASLAANEFMLATQADWQARRGFYVYLSCSAEGDAVCPLHQMKLGVGVADGKDWRYVASTPKWEFDRSYRVKAVVSPTEATLWLDGTEVGASPGGFVSENKDMELNTMPLWSSSPTDYFVLVDSARVSQGDRSESLSFKQEAARPMGLVMFEPQSPRRITWRIAERKAVTVEVEFRLVKRPEITSLAPYIDRYGQCRYADWPGKIKLDDDLRKSAADEDARLRKMGEVVGYDKYGGYLAAGWTERPTGFYRVAQRDGFWWLITPEGNPCFYVGLCTVSPMPWESTLVTGRESLFESLPPKTSLGWVKNAMGERSGCDYLAFAGPNMVVKYGDGWKDRLDEVARRRVKTWGFSGVGKWGELKGMPVVPVLNRVGVPDVVDHPDVFDQGVLAKFEDVLRRQIEPRVNDPMVVGWSLGNEIHEIIKAREIEDILANRACPPIKRALIDKALEVHGDDLAALCSAWNVKADSKEALYDRSLKAPASDVEELRRFYAWWYYYQANRLVKRIDPNHLYFGFWIVPGWWENEHDWQLAAKHCDVIGYDLYSYDHTDKLLMRLAEQTKMPIFCGEFSFPAYYRGMRGFGVYPVFADDDADSGDKYARWLQQAARNPYCVGALWFHYRDQMLTGRGPGAGLKLVHGEHYAFGTVDVADRPKWDLVERMRKANVSAAKWRVDAAQAERQ